MAVAAARRARGPEHAIGTINNLTHSSGPFARQPFNLRPWQTDIVRRLFSVNQATGLRQYRTCLLMLPRKNGKSELAAAIALYGLLADGEISAQVYSAAADREQASLVFNVAAQMIRNDPELNAMCEIVDSQKRIVHRASGSIYRAISADAHTKHGFNASLVIYDELHAAPNRELWDVLTTSMGAREQPLTLAISTAGYDRRSILWELYEHACKVRDGIVEDPTFLPILYEAPKEADWLDEAVWHQANPALGDFRGIEEMRVTAARAKSIPAQENTFRRLYLNQWTEQAERWIALDAWDGCIGAVEPRKGQRCYVGVDLSSTRDLTAVVAVFPDAVGGGFSVIPHFFVPQSTMHLRTRRDRVQYEEWERRGFLTATEGDAVDYERVRASIQRLARDFQVRNIGFDPWNALDLMGRIQQEDGLPCTVIPQGKKLAASTKELERAILARDVRHDGHPVLRWNISNVSVKADSEGNIYPTKSASSEKIDGAIALILAIDCMSRDHQPVYSYEVKNVADYL